MPDSALPENLRGKKHWDWPWPFSKISRGATAFNWGMPKLVRGSQKGVVVDGAEPAPHPKPIGEPGSWQLSRFPLGPWYAWYFAFTLKNGRHFRVGARWDDVDGYVQFPTLAWRRYTGGDGQDTSTRGAKS